MDIRVSGHQVDIGDAFRAHVTERLESMAEKYFARAIGATVTLTSGPHDNGFVCDIVDHVMHGVILKGSGRGAEANRAFDQAADKIETQLRRYMQRLKSRHTQAAASPDQFDAGYTVFQPDKVEDEAGDSPLTIAETRIDIPETTVSDAVMMLDLRNTTALLFRNTGTGTFNMVYRREDGNIGWVEPPQR